jgi:hypothetical protein
MRRSTTITGMTVYSALPERLEAAVAEVLGAAGMTHVAHGAGDAMAGAEAAAADDDALALIGPFTSRAVAHAVEATAPVGLPLIAPVATWAGVTRDDEPGCEDDPAQHRGTVLRMVARDTVVAERIAAHVRAQGKRALVIAGEHEYGEQLDGQLRLAELPRTDAGADVVVLCGLAGHPEIDAARATGLPVIAFDGAERSDLGDDVSMALPFAPLDGVPFDHMTYGAEQVRRAAHLIVEAGASDRTALLRALRAAGPFDEHGDPIDPPVWLWRADRDWALRADRAL